MADTKISDLPAASALTGTEEIPLSDGTATTKACTVEQLAVHCRGYQKYLIRQNASRTLTNAATEQRLFDGSTNGRVTLPTGTYFFRCQFSLSGMSATSGNAAFDLLGAGTATLGTVLYQVSGADGNANTTANQTGSTSTNAQSPASAVSAGTGTAAQFHIWGTFEVTATGTIQPAVTLVTAAAATLAAGSYFMCERMGDDALVSIGTWD